MNARMTWHAKDDGHIIDVIGNCKTVNDVIVILSDPRVIEWIESAGYIVIEVNAPNEREERIANSPRNLGIDLR